MLFKYPPVPPTKISKTIDHHVPSQPKSIYRILYPTVADYNFCLSSLDTYNTPTHTKNDNTLGHKENFNMFQDTEIICSVFPKSNAIMLEISNNDNWESPIYLKPKKCISKQ